MGSVFGGLSGLTGTSLIVTALQMMAVGLVMDLSVSQATGPIALLSYGLPSGVSAASF